MTLLQDNPTIFIILSILVVITLIAEMRISSKWKAFYFLKGPVIFLKKYRINSADSIYDLSTKLEQQFSNNWLPSILFRQLDQDAIAFRETLFEFVLLTYTPVMHGTISVNQTASEITITGRANWFLMAFSLFWLLSCPLGSLGIIFLIVLISALYGTQFYRFSKVGETTLNILKANSGTQHRLQPDGK
jgi:hypothetical protein